MYEENTEQAVAFRGEEHRLMLVLNSRGEGGEYEGLVRIIVFSTNSQAGELHPGMYTSQCYSQDIL